MTEFKLTDLIAKHRWLFDDQFPETGLSEQDYEERREEIDVRRRQAITEIRQSQGWEGIHLLIQTVRYSYIVGYVAAELADGDVTLLDAMHAWQKGNTPAEMSAFQAAAGARYNEFSTRWTDAMLLFAGTHGWSPQTISTALLDYPDEKATYETVKTLTSEAESNYWRCRNAFIRAATGEDETFAIAAKALLKHGRAYELVDNDWHRIATMGYATVLDVLDALIEQLSTQSVTHHSGTIGHDVEHLFVWLRKQPEARHDEIARREYLLLPLLTAYGEEASLSLHELMRDDPAFFTDVLCDLYKAASDERSLEGEALEQARGRANAAYRILESWHTPPGVVGNVIDEQALNSWIEAARTLLRARDRADIGDEQIGKLLYHTPLEESDRTWPSIPIRKLLQKIKSDDIERGIILENFNSRGVTSRAMFEGGIQERELASKWRAFSERLGMKWSRSKALCRKMAEQWNMQAKENDESAKSQRVKYSR